MTVLLVVMVASGKDGNYERSKHTSWGGRYFPIVLLVNWMITILPEFRIGGYIETSETGTSGNYLTLEFRSVVAEAFDKMEKHVWANYERLNGGDGWFWGFILSFSIIQVEILWLYGKLLMRSCIRSKKVRAQKDMEGALLDAQRV